VQVSLGFHRFPNGRLDEAPPSDNRSSCRERNSLPWPSHLPPLPYAYDALEPAIDKETMTFHHDKHHQTYVDNLNKAVDADADLQGKSLEEIFTSISTAPKAVRNNGGGHWNHSLFWELLAPADQAGEPSAELKAAIDSDLGGMDKFKEDFNAAGAAQFGSGWAWLIVQNGKLKITSTPNQDNPLMDVVEERGEVVLGADVWEHAYYLKYQNRRADYLKSFWSVVNWNKVNELYAAAV
jgi:superoxide dismutase, Fe-Mn family